MNRERQEIERTIAQEAMLMVEHDYAGHEAYVLSGPQWHTGVVGIVASRVSNHFHRPTIVLGTEENGMMKGSGRSAMSVDLVDTLGDCAHLVETWGGHPMAVGITLRAERVETFRAAFRDAVAKRISGHDLEPELEIALWVEPRDLSENLFRELEQMGPYGQGNPQPIIAVRSANVPYPATPFGGGHCRFVIDMARGQRMPCVAWRTGDRPPPPNTRVDIAAKLTWNVWKGQRTAQLQVEDWKLTP
jgi:single-stranded-DNA-specific exonuclease